MMSTFLGGGLDKSGVLLVIGKVSGTMYLLELVASKVDAGSGFIRSGWDWYVLDTSGCIAANDALWEDGWVDGCDRSSWVL